MDPVRLKADVTASIATLNGLIAATLVPCDHHHLLRIDGLDQPTIVGPLAIYLVGAVAACVEGNLRIREALFDGTTMTADLSADLRSIIGDDNTITSERKRDFRNPWIWEVMSHLFAHLAQTDASKHPPGKILAKTMPHLDIREHGIDLIALYDANMLGLAVGECKAYLQDPARAIGDCAGLFAEVDQTTRDHQIRESINQIQGGLDGSVSARIAGTFWREERCYLPMVCCDRAHAVNWERRRPSLTDLQVQPNRKLLVPMVISNSDQFFDELADAMRAYALTP